MRKKVEQLKSSQELIRANREVRQEGEQIVVEGARGGVNRGMGVEVGLLEEVHISAWLNFYFIYAVHGWN
jgi:hypothetical protein